MTRPIITETIDYLTTWREAFMQGTDWAFERKLGITEIRDELSGIEVDGIQCYASYLFNQLTLKDKQVVTAALYWYVDFDGLYCTYDL